MSKIKAGTIGGLGGAMGGLLQLVKEDNGQTSSTRILGYSVVGLIVEDVGVRGNPLNLFHVILFGSFILAKAIQKFAEKPAQGVVNAKALEFLINDAVKKISKENPGGE